MAGVAEMPAHPPPIKGMTDASNKDFAMGQTLTTWNILKQGQFRNFFSCEGKPYVLLALQASLDPRLRGGSSPNHYLQHKNCTRPKKMLKPTDGHAGHNLIKEAK
jgi:hypothetical protein